MPNAFDLDRSAATLEVFEPKDFRPVWHPDVIAKAPEVLMDDYVLSTKAVRLLLGTEQLGGIPKPVTAQAVSALCKRGVIDWISVSPRGSRRPVRAFSRAGVEAYFAYARDGKSVPWHRLPLELRQSMGIDY